MASFSHLAPELLAHILQLSTEDGSAEAEQRSRFRFGQVARAFYLATAETTRFFVAGGSQAGALLAKLQREKELAAQAERKASCEGSSTPSSGGTRGSVVLRLSLVLNNNVDTFSSIFARLLLATPDLIALELDAASMTRASLPAPESLAEIEAALQGLASLRELQYSAFRLDKESFLRILIPLRQLQVLDLQFIINPEGTDDYPLLLSHLSLPHVRHLRVSLETRPRRTFISNLVGALAATSTTGIQVLDLAPTRFYSLSSAQVDPILPHLTKTVHLTWTPLPDPPEEDARDALLELLGAMTSLQSICISMWALLDEDFDYTYDNPAIDTTLFDTLATLSNLHTVNLIVDEGTLDESKVVGFIESCKSLKILSLHVKTSWLGGEVGVWTREQRQRVDEAGDKAGVTFVYSSTAVGL